MADEKVRHDFSGRPLRPFGELDPEPSEPYPSITEFSTRDGRYAVEEGGAWYEADAAGDPILDRPIDADQVIL